MICHARDNAKEAQEEFYCFLGKRSFGLQQMLMILMDTISVS